MECFLTNLGGYEGRLDYIHLFEIGYVVTHTIILAELSIEHLIEFWPKLKSVCQSVLKYSDGDDSYVKLAECSFSASLHFKKQMNAVRDDIRKLKYPNQKFI